MAIDRTGAGNRKRIVWLRVPAPEKAVVAFESRGFEVCDRYSDEGLGDAGFVSGTGAVVLTLDRQKPSRIRREIEQHLERLLDFDCRVLIHVAQEIVEPGSRDTPPPDWRAIVVACLCDLGIRPAGLIATDECKGQQNWVEKQSVPALPHARIVSDSETWESIANFLCDHQPGVAPAPREQLQITVRNEFGRSLPEPTGGRDLLFRRAFQDCETLHLVHMSGGKSGVEVFRAYPKSRGGLSRTKLLQPYFVKVGDRDKVFAEYENYLDAVEGYIPFHLGPGLVEGRCCLGGRDGIIVGDWVEESESLQDCASSGRAAAAIACLFDRTLHGWYRNAVPQDLSVGEALEGKFPSRPVPEARMVRAQELGAARGLDELRALLKNCDARPTLVGPLHGDLHSSNVRVRATDAIVIDFGAYAELPVLFDFACLEASVFIDGFAHHDGFEQWWPPVERLYTPIEMHPRHTEPHDIGYWFNACVRQIRHHAARLECADGQYAACVAVALLLKATKDPDLPEPEASRRAAAYVIAERVLSTLSASPSAANET